MEWGPLVLSLRLALITTLVLLIMAIPVANWLSTTRSRSKPILEAIISLPLVLPPTVIGFYLLLLFSPGNALGKFLGLLDIQLVFTFPGLVIASVIYSLPFMIQPIQAGLSSLPASLREASYVLGKSGTTTLLRVLLPNIKPSILTAIILTFAHTLGEFGIVLMIGGNIPGVTRVASIAIYDEVEALNYMEAHFYSGFLLALTFIILSVVYIFNGGYLKRLVR